MNKVGPFLQNSAKAKTPTVSPLSTTTSKAPTKLVNGKPVDPDYKLNLSDKSKELQNNLQKAQEPKVETSSTSSSSSSTSSDLSVDIPETPAPEVPNVEVKDVVEKASQAKQAKDLAETAKLKMDEAKLKKTPAVFFIRAFEFVETPFFGNGMKSMAEATEGARYYAWDQKDEMVEQIKKRDKDQPVVLVGHGFGGDTAVEVAQALNTVDNGFRKVDLLVTLNSTGMNNDFIPQNVVKNLNFLTADNGITDDGPNIALNYHRTEVQNFLRPEKHSALDDSTDIQIEIMDAINKIL